MKVSPHVAAYKSSVTDVKFYASRAYNQSNTEFLRTRLADFLYPLVAEEYGETVWLNIWDAEFLLEFLLEFLHMAGFQQDKIG